MSDAESGADGGRTDVTDDLARRVSQLEATAVCYDDPEMAALRDALAALAGQEIDSDDPSSWLQAANAARERMAQLEDALDSARAGAVAQAEHKLEGYSHLPQDVREETLGATERRAVALYEHWDDIAEWTNIAETYAVTTHRTSQRKNSPSKIRADINAILDEDLAWTQIYRVMKRFAEMSGGEERTDEYGREHVEGGAFEYHERATPDGSSTYKVLEEAVDR